MDRRKVTVILLPNDIGGFQVFIPHFPNCLTEGDSLDEALHNAKEALEALLEEPTELDLEALDYSHAPVVVVGEIEVEVPVQAEVTTSA